MSSFQFITQHNSYPVNINIDKSLKQVNCNDNATKTTVIFLNALGVPLKKYQKVIAGLTTKGFTVVSADYPCCGENTPHVNRDIDYGYNDLISSFIPSLIEEAKEVTPDNNIVLLGHSLGGHVGTIYSAIHDFPIIGVACGSVHYKNWQGLGRLRIFNAVTAIQVLVRIYGYLPGHLIGFGKREPKTQMHEWCRTALTGRFDFIKKVMDKTKGNGLYINIVGDDFAPIESTTALAKMCANHIIVRTKLDEDLTGNQHGVWIKRPDSVIDLICHNLNDLLAQ